MKLTINVCATPVPDRATVCTAAELLFALSAMSTCPVSGPAAFGVNATVIVHVPFGAIVAAPDVPQAVPLLEFTAKFDGFPTDGSIATEETVSGAFPELVSVTV